MSFGITKNVHVFFFLKHSVRIFLKFLCIIGAIIWFVYRLANTYWVFVCCLGRFGVIISFPEKIFRIEYPENYSVWLSGKKRIMLEYRLGKYNWFVYWLSKFVVWVKLFKKILLISWVQVSAGKNLMDFCI